MTRTKSKITNITINKKVHRYNPSFKVTADLECIICMEVKKECVLTRWWMKVICIDCQMLVKGKCPLRCHQTSTKYFVSHNLKIALMKCYELCPVWNSKVKPWRLQKHSENWINGKIPQSNLLVANLHSSTLSEVSLPTLKCHLNKYARSFRGNHPCLQRNSNKTHHGRNSSCYKCNFWDVTFCTNCIREWLFGEFKKIAFTHTSCTMKPQQNNEGVTLTPKDPSEIESSEVYPSKMIQLLDTQRLLIHQL